MNQMYQLTLSSYVITVLFVIKLVNKCLLTIINCFKIKLQKDEKNFGLFVKSEIRVTVAEI
jgi:hypothetical protein